MGSVEKTQTAQLKRNEDKWTRTLMDAGWTVLPSIILEKQHALGLDAIDVNILMHLARHWWYSENLPHPSKAAIAECMNISKSTVQRRIAQMEKAGFIKRIARYREKYGQDTNAYEFDGLIELATPFAQEAVTKREQRRNEDAASRKRKRPAPKLVVNNEPGGKKR